MCAFARACCCCWLLPARAEDGYDLWLRYRPMEAGAQAQYRPLATGIVVGRHITDAGCGHATN